MNESAIIIGLLVALLAIGAAAVFYLRKHPTALGALRVDVTNATKAATDEVQKLRDELRNAQAQAKPAAVAALASTPPAAVPQQNGNTVAVSPVPTVAPATATPTPAAPPQNTFDWSIVNGEWTLMDLVMRFGGRSLSPTELELAYAHGVPRPVPVVETGNTPQPGDWNYNWHANPDFGDHVGNPKITNFSGGGVPAMFTFKAPSTPIKFVAGESGDYGSPPRSSYTLAVLELSGAPLCSAPPSATGAYAELGVPQQKKDSNGLIVAQGVVPGTAYRLVVIADGGPSRGFVEMRNAS
jgi:hypothetical protein